MHLGACLTSVTARSFSPFPPFFYLFSSDIFEFSMQRYCLARSAWRSSVQVGREGTPGSPGLAGGVSFSSSILTAEHRSVYVTISCILNLFGLVWMTIVHIAPPSRPMGWDPLFIPPPLFLRITPFWCFGSLRFALQASFALGSVAPVWYFSGFIFMSRECLVY
ncbi:hypothetical protein B0H11DRAFT_2058332, partial [Mycena galericulata]